MTLPGKKWIVAVAGVLAVVAGFVAKSDLFGGKETATQLAREAVKTAVKLSCALPDANRFGAVDLANDDLEGDDQGVAVACSAEELEHLARGDTGAAVVEEAKAEAAAAAEVVDAETATIVEAGEAAAEAVEAGEPVEPSEPDEPSQPSEPAEPAN